MSGLTALAASDEAWPEPVYFPQRSEQTSTQNPLASQPEKDKDAHSKKKRDLWPFNNHKEEPPALKQEEKSSKAGREPLASPYPLLRLSLPIQSGEQGVIQPGIYLVKPSTSANKKADPDNATPADSRTGKVFLLTQRDRLILRFKALPIPNIDSNLETEGTPSPLSKKDPEKPTPMRSRIRMAEDGQSLVIQVLENEQAFESPSFPTVTDPRKILSY